MRNRLSTVLPMIVVIAFAGCASTPEPTPEPPKPAPRRAELTPPPQPKAVSGKVTIASEPYFDFDRAVIRPDARARLDDQVSKLRDLNLEAVTAVGHADRIGSDAYNMKLSLRRADAVKAYLVSKGIQAARIRTEGKGKRQPVKECPGTRKTKELIACLQPNRRVEVEAVGSR